MKVLTIFGFICFCFLNVYAETIVVGGKPYDVQPTELLKCGEDVSSPDFAALSTLLSLSQKTGEGTWKAACEAGVQNSCTPEDIKKAGLKAVFSTIRKYPSALSNPTCKIGREDCEKRCLNTKVFDEKVCVIECNQYETWNP